MSLHRVQGKGLRAATIIVMQPPLEVSDASPDLLVMSNQPSRLRRKAAFWALAVFTICAVGFVLGRGSNGTLLAPSSALISSSVASTVLPCEAAVVVINEIHSKGIPEDWIELKNAGEDECSLAGWKVFDQDTFDDSTKAEQMVEFGADGTPAPVLEPGAFYIGYKNGAGGNFGFAFGVDPNEAIYLEAPNGIRTRLRDLGSGHATGRCNERVMDLDYGTPGAEVALALLNSPKLWLLPHIVSHLDPPLTCLLAEPLQIPHHPAASAADAHAVAALRSYGVAFEPWRLHAAPQLDRSAGQRRPVRWDGGGADHARRGLVGRQPDRHHQRRISISSRSAATAAPVHPSAARRGRVNNSSDACSRFGGIR